MFRSVTALALSSLALLVAGSSPTLEGNTVGDFVMLGSLCFPPGATDQVKIQTNSPIDGQNLLFFDDQTSSFDQINTLGAGASCYDREQLARPICSGSSCTPGYKIPKGTPSPYLIDISETFARRWYFIASNCQKQIGAKTYSAKQVQLTSFEISSNAAINCDSVGQPGDNSGFIVAIVFLVMIVFVLSGTTYYMWKRNAVPLPLSQDKVGYNTL
eukprot:Stramenopile-MAST_4_protein_522